MAQTKSQWAAKLKSFVPGWWFQEGSYFAAAVFNAAAAVFATLDQDQEDMLNTTFITRSAAPVEDLLGDERSKTRLTGETNPNYATRIQRITSFTDAPDILAAVNAILSNPGAKLLEAPTDSPYCSRGTFLSRDNYLSAFLDNYFAIVVPLQNHVPYTFAFDGNEATAQQLYFASRKNFVGNSGSSEAIYPALIALVNSMKAFGVLFRVIESTKSTVV